MNRPFDPSDIEALAGRIAAHLLSAGSAGTAADSAPFPGAQRDGPLPDIQFGSRMVLDSVEYTQSIQYNGSAGQGYGPNNGVPLVAYKAMVARAYPFVHHGALGGDSLTGQRVTGELTLSTGDRVIYRADPTRSDGARIGSPTHMDRGSWDREFMAPAGGKGILSVLVPANCPLNFMIPAYYCKPGRIYATVRLWPVADGPSSSLAVSSSQYLLFLNVQAPKVCLVRISWRDSAGTVNRPSDSEMLATIAAAGRMLPFPYFESLILGIEETRGDNFGKVADEPGGCNLAWSSLISRLNVTRIFTTLFGLGQIVFGMVSQAAIPTDGSSYNAGCGHENEAGAGFSGEVTTFAHEIGHLYGRNHVAVAGDDTNDTQYPNYGSKRSIGEVGIDTGTAPPALLEPWNYDDIMSYGTNRWISPYTYEKILDQRGRYDSVVINTARLRLLLFLDFRVHRAVDGVTRVELRRSTIVEAPGPLPFRGSNAVSPISLDLVDGNENIVATHHCTWAAAHGSGQCGCCSNRPNVPFDREPWLDFQEVMEWPRSGVAKIAFHRGKEPFHTIEVGEPPVVSIEEPVREESYLTVKVSASHPREQVTIVVLFSGDYGATWQPVAFDPPEGEVKIHSDRLPGGDRCLVRAIATAQLRSATADTQPFTLPRNARRLYMSRPKYDCPICPGPVSLSVAVDTRGLGAIAPSDIRWSSNLDGELGFGYAVTADLREGQHEVTVTAPDGLGGALAEHGIIIVGGRSQRRQ